MINVILPDGKKVELEENSTGLGLLEILGPRLKKSALALKMNSQLFDLDHQLEPEAQVEIITFNSEDGKEILRHSASHIMAQAVLELYPEAKLGIGPSIEDGFYYDFLLTDSLNPEDLERITKQMNKIIQKKLSIKREVLTKKEALEHFNSMGQDFKVELINELEKPEITVYTRKLC